MSMAVWFLVGAILVFFMQCGFAMVETGFTRAKNAGNIIMKNLMDFCIGTVMFFLLGYGLMMGRHGALGLIGRPEWGMFLDFEGFDWSSFVFQLVFCATAATIVSGAMAERTKFSAYCLYSAIISLLVYPIEAGWVWGGGWLSRLSFIDFAGSCVIHMTGGLSALVGAVILGPRIGKYTKKPDGSITSNAIPGHSVTLGALGVFILWFAWYGFNGAAAADVGEMARIFGTTTIAPAVATVTCMLFTWRKNGKPDVSMCLNASLAGLVAITAGCASVDALGAAVIGVVSGILGGGDPGHPFSCGRSRRRGGGPRRQRDLGHGCRRPVCLQRKLRRQRPLLRRGAAAAGRAVPRRPHHRQLYGAVHVPGL